MRHSSSEAHEAGNSAAFTLGRLGQQILNLFDGARAAERRDLAHLDRRLLDDVGLTPADVAPGLDLLCANDFRVAHFIDKRAA